MLTGYKIEKRKEYMISKGIKFGIVLFKNPEMDVE